MSNRIFNICLLIFVPVGLLILFSTMYVQSKQENMEYKEFVEHCNNINGHIEYIFRDGNRGIGCFEGPQTKLLEKFK